MWSKGGEGYGEKWLQAAEVGEGDLSAACVGVLAQYGVIDWVVAYPL